MSVTVIEFVTLDGFVQDPDGSGGTPSGGWAFRFGPEAVAGDKFKLGPMLSTGTMLLGRRTWELFARIWPTRTDEFSTAMNRIPKLVASRSLSTVDAWANSSLLGGELVAEVGKLRAERELVVAGSVEVVHALAPHRLVDEYRLLTFPVALGSGQPLFAGPVDLRLKSVEQAGAATLSRYEC